MVTMAPKRRTTSAAAFKLSVAQREQALRSYRAAVAGFDFITDAREKCAQIWGAFLKAEACQEGSKHGRKEERELGQTLKKSLQQG